MTGLTERCGWQRITSSGVIGDAGKAIIVLGYSVDAGASAATPVFRNGSAASAPVAFNGETTAATMTSDTNVSVGRMLYNGCYVSFDANTVAMTVFYVQDQS